MTVNTHRSGRLAFTLIEVLVVVAIIALLTAILLPSLSRVRFQAKLLTCQSRLHDLGTSSLMYANVSKGFFPLTANSGSDNFYSLWKARMLPNRDVLICPSTTNQIRPVTLTWSIATQNGPGGAVPYFRNAATAETGDLSKQASQGRTDGSGGHSFEYQGCYDGSYGDKIWPLKGAHKKVDHFAAFQSQMPLIFDNDPAIAAMGPRASEGCIPSRSNNGNNCPQPWDNHGAEGTNMLMGDGHTEFARKTSGKYNDMSANSPADWGKPGIRDSKNAKMDQLMVRTQYPWQYFKR